jgi:hypothetical protein
VKAYQSDCLKESVAPKSINDEVGFLLRLLADSGDILRARLKKNKTQKLSVPPTIGKPYSHEEEGRAHRERGEGAFVPY